MVFGVGGDIQDGKVFLNEGGGEQCERDDMKEELWVRHTNL